MTTLPAGVLKNLPKIRLILLDVDGVLTDGRVGRLASGEEIKFFSVYDGLGIRLAQKAGWEVGFLSGRSSQEVEARARELGVEIVIQGSRDKVKDFEEILNERNLEASQVAYIGDDLPDIALLKRVGFSAAPGNAAEAVRDCVDYVTQQNGGHGAVREVVDLLLKVSGKWEEILVELYETGTMTAG
ncbi:HAD-IIIA family hydrolase [Acidobacteria bacterium AH-259-D05]|nr:HAD-IIIA family hydrolase [Acidobacteria bacterium AH-259-D05]